MRREYETVARRERRQMAALTMTQRVTDQMVRAALKAVEHIEGYTYGHDTANPVHVIRDISKPDGEQELYRQPGPIDIDLWLTILQRERMRIAIAAALACGEKELSR